MFILECAPESSPDVHFVMPVTALARTNMIHLGDSLQCFYLMLDGSTTMLRLFAPIALALVALAA